MREAEREADSEKKNGVGEWERENGGERKKKK